VEEVVPVTKAAEYLLTNGVLGFTTMLFLSISWYLYRARELDRKQFASDVEEIHRAHRIELAALNNRIHELQETRITEIRSVIDASAKFSQTLNSVLAVIGKTGAAHD
jgi:type VI protein secretion system component VasK